MDIKKLNIPTLDGPSWGIYIISLQALARILDIWDAMRGEILPTTPPTYDLLVKPTPVAANATATKIAAYTTAKTIWSEKNAQGLGLMQASIVTIHMDSFLLFSHLLQSDSYFPHLWLIVLTLTPPWLIDLYCTFTIYTARYPLVTSAKSYSNIPEF